MPAMVSLPSTRTAAPATGLPVESEVTREDDALRLLERR